MIKLDRLKSITRNFTDKKIAVIGDMMLDGYFWGRVSRVSPEAPVPVVEIEKEFFKFGGAANVALNIHSLGAVPIPVGIIGNDKDGTNFLNLLKEADIISSGIFIDPNRTTTVKTRVIADSQHVVRIDKENNEYINSEFETKIIEFLNKQIKRLDAIILQDYNKGILSPGLIEEIIKLANENRKIISVDPKFLNFRKYQNVTILKPNSKETEDILGFLINSDKSISEAGEKLLKMSNSKYVLLTLGEKGIALFEKDKNEIRIPTKARKVADVSGAGDTVISTLTLALSADATIEEAAYIANYAAGLVCENVGIVPIEKEILLNEISKSLL